MKQVSIAQLMALIPDVSRLRVRVKEGVLAGTVLSVQWTGEWSGAVGRRLDQGVREQLGDQIIGDSAAGEVTLTKPRLRKAQFTDEVDGVSTCIELTLAPPAEPVRRVFRCFVKTAPDLLNAIMFTGRIKDDAAHRVVWSYLPLTVDGEPLDVFYLPEGPFLVLETRDQRLDIRRFHELANSTRNLLSYLTGQRLDGDSCDVVTTEGEQVLHVRWHAGRDRRSHFYSAIPCSTAEWLAAQRVLNLPRAGRPLVPDVLSKCLATFLAKPGLITPVEYTLSFPDAPLEMRGALLSVALESLTAQMEEEGLLATVKPLDDEKWKALRNELEKLLAIHGATWNQAQRDVFRNRLLNANNPTNRDKLTRPFDLYGIKLGPNDLKAISERNTLLHEGRLLDPRTLREDPEAWRDAYLIEMRLFTAVNRLLLRHLGYSGPIIDWGAREFDPENDASYAMLEAQQR